MKRCDCSNRPDYLSVYFSRVTHLGESVAEVAQNSGVISFKKWLAESPNAVDLQVEDSFYFKGIILSKKQDESKLIKQLCVALTTPLKIGHIVIWDDEKWIVYQKERKVRETYQSFYMVRCNYLIKWVDSEGHIQKSWCYFSSSLDSKVKENFRTWNNLITPQPNKYAEILLPRKEISRQTKFIVEDEAWLMVEADFSSVPGVMYASLTEDKINLYYDDLKEDIADRDKEAKYTISLPSEVQKVALGERVELIFAPMKNGKPVSIETKISLPSRDYLNYDKEKNIIAKKEGTAEIIVAFGTEEFIVPIEIVQKVEQLTGYISGFDSLKLNQSTSYELILNQTIEDEVIFSIKDSSILISLRPYINEKGETVKNKVVVRANGKNKLGTATLIANYKEQTFEKEIKIIPLW